MGAATVLSFYEDFVYSKPDAEKLIGIKAIVADSPFTNFRETISNKIDSYFFVNLFKERILYKIEDHVSKTFNFNISDIHLFKGEGDIYNEVPIVMIASTEDELTRFEVIEKLSKRLKGDHQLIAIRGKHNGKREPEILRIVHEFLFRILDKDVRTFEARFSNIDVNDIDDIKKTSMIS